MSARKITGQVIGQRIDGEHLLAGLLTRDMYHGDQRGTHPREHNLVHLRKVTAMAERRTNHLTRKFLAEMSQLEKRRASLVSEKTVPPNRLAFDNAIRRFVERRLRDARSVIWRIKSSAGLRLK